MIKANKLFSLLVLGLFSGCHLEQDPFSFKEDISLTGGEAKVKGGVLKFWPLVYCRAWEY